MANPKKQTLQQRFGFADEDLKTSEHDKIIFWLQENSIEIAKKILRWSDIWDKKHIDELGSEAQIYVESKAAYYQKRIEELIDIDTATEKFNFYMSYNGLQKAPIKPSLQVFNELEYVISKKDFIIGFIDCKMSIYQPSLILSNFPQFKGDSWKEYDDLPELVVDERLSCTTKYFEVKTEIKSFGELLRQINIYREYTDSKFYVVSPDTRFIDQLLSQRVGFIKYPTREIYS